MSTLERKGIKLNLPVKINASHVSLLLVEMPIPNHNPPNNPETKHDEPKRLASHLCHYKTCVRASHITWGA